jgi:hypothetical protein
MPNTKGPDAAVHVGGVHERQDLSDDHYNIFRDSALRYMGYANEIGESFRYQVRVRNIHFIILSFVEVYSFLSK